MLYEKKNWKLDICKKPYKSYKNLLVTWYQPSKCLQSSCVLTSPLKQSLYRWQVINEVRMFFKWPSKIHLQQETRLIKRLEVYFPSDVCVNRDQLSAERLVQWGIYFLPTVGWWVRDWCDHGMKIAVRMNCMKNECLTSELICFRSEAQSYSTSWYQSFCGSKLAFRFLLLVCIMWYL